MTELLSWLFGDTGTTPHGYCLIWRDDLILMHAGSDILIALAYLVIPFAILRVRALNPELLPRGLSFLFVGFILTCSITHMFNLVTLWQPIYGASSIGKILCAVVSVATAIYLLLNYPKAARIPSVNQLMTAQAGLKREILEHRRTEAQLKELAQTLEERVQERTEELRVALEKERAAKDELGQVMAMRDRFVASVSHDFKTPLNAIIGFSESLKMRLHGDELKGKNADYVNYIYTAGQSLKNFVIELIDCFQVESNDMRLSITEVDVAEVMGQTHEEFAPLAERKGLTLRRTSDPGLFLSGDENLCRRALRNLVSNAIKYTAKGEVAIEARREGDFVAFSVADTGIGIDEDELPLIFNEFHSSGDIYHTRDSHGLGLTIVKSIARRHGGSIKVTSTPGVGSTFTLRLRQLNPGNDPVLPLRPVMG